jgi:hypothetical protein
MSDQSRRQYRQHDQIQRFLMHASVLAFDLNDKTTRLRDLECRLECMAFILPTITLTEATKNFPLTLSELRKQVKGRSRVVPVKRGVLRVVLS